MLFFQCIDRDSRGFINNSMRHNETVPDTYESINIYALNGALVVCWYDVMLWCWVVAIESVHSVLG